MGHSSKGKEPMIWVLRLVLFLEFHVMIVFWVMDRVDIGSFVCAFAFPVSPQPVLCEQIQHLLNTAMFLFHWQPREQLPFVFCSSDPVFRCLFGTTSGGVRLDRKYWQGEFGRAVLWHQRQHLLWDSSRHWLSFGAHLWSCFFGASPG